MDLVSDVGLEPDSEVEFLPASEGLDDSELDVEGWDGPLLSFL